LSKQQTQFGEENAGKIRLSPVSIRKEMQKEEFKARWILHKPNPSDFLKLETICVKTTDNYGKYAERKTDVYLNIYLVKYFLKGLRRIRSTAQEPNLTPTNFEVRVGLNNNKSFSYVMHSTSV
jgi:hypothetical protein